MAERLWYLACNLVWSITTACLVTKPLNRSEAKGDLVMIQPLLLFK